MNNDTPLAQVALMLPTEAAGMLTWETVNRQMAVLHVVRRCVSEWEALGTTLDPITLAVILNSLVREVLGVVTAVEQMLTEDFDPIRREP